MGLISRVLTLPLAPVSGVVWVTEQLEQEATRAIAAAEAAEMRAELDRLGAALGRGDIDELEFARREEALLRRMAARTTTSDRSVR